MTRPAPSVAAGCVVIPHTGLACFKNGVLRLVSARVAVRWKNSGIGLITFSALVACNSGEGGGVELSASGDAGTSASQSASGADGSGSDGASTSNSGTNSETGDEGPKLDFGGDGGTAETGGTMGGCDDLGALPTNQGCEFWAVDLPNVSQVLPFTLDVVPADQQFAVVVVNPSDADGADVQIYQGDGTTPVDGGAVPFDTVRIFQLPALNITPGATTQTGEAYRIESDLPVVVYQFQPLDNTSPVYSNDATILFPTHVLTGDYTAITGDATFDPDDGFGVADVNTGAFISVVATENDTLVTLHPTGGLHPGAFEDVLLQRGQVLTGISSERGAPSYGNLSGSRIIADKPVAVFSGSTSTSEPSNPVVCCADHLEHQMLPLSAWGNAYVAAPAAAAVGMGSDDSLYRITGVFDGTTLVYDPAPPAGAPTVINEEETISFITDTPFTVHSTDDAKTFTVSQFLLSNQYFSAFSRPGDPSMIVLPAAEQFQSQYTFYLPLGYARDFVTIIRPLGAELTLDGSAFSGATFFPLGMLDGTSYEYTHVELPGGSHRLEGDAPFGIIASGHDSDVSFGYAGGSGIGVISVPPPPPVD